MQGIGSLRAVLGSYRVAAEAVAIVAVLVAIRAVIWHLGITGMSTTALTSSVIGGGVFVMGLVVAGTLSDYRDAERAPTDIAAKLLRLAPGSRGDEPGLGKTGSRGAAQATDRGGDVLAVGHQRGQHPRLPGGGRGFVGIAAGTRGVRRPGQLHRPAACRAGGLTQGHLAHVPHSARSSCRRRKR